MKSDLVKFEIEIENFQKVMYCPILKSYASIILNLYNNEEKIVIKGVSWKHYTKPYKQFLKTQFELILKNYHNKGEIILSIRQQIDDFIEQKNLEMITLQQKCGKSKSGKYL